MDEIHNFVGVLEIDTNRMSVSDGNLHHTFPLRLLIVMMILGMTRNNKFDNFLFYVIMQLNRDTNSVSYGHKSDTNLTTDVLTYE